MSNTYLLQLFDTLSQAQSPTEVVVAQLALSRHYRHASEISPALTFAGLAHHIARQNRLSDLASRALLARASALLWSKQYSSCSYALQAVLNTCQTPWCIARTYSYLGIVHHKLRKPDAALNAAYLSLDGWTKLAEPFEIAVAQANLAAVVLREDRNLAYKSATAALRYFQQKGKQDMEIGPLDTLYRLGASPAPNTKPSTVHIPLT